MWLEVVSNLDIFLWQWKERINGSQLLPEHKGKRTEGKNVSVYETSHPSCSFLSGIDFYYYVYGFKSAVTFYTYIFSYESKWWISQNLISSWISLEKQASFLYNVIVDVHFLTKSQEASMVISLTCFHTLQKMNNGKRWQEYFYYWLKYYWATENLEIRPLHICKRIKLNPVLSQRLAKKFVSINFTVMNPPPYSHPQFTTSLNMNNILIDEMFKL